MISIIIWLLKLPIWLAVTIILGVVAVLHVVIEYSAKLIGKVLLFIPRAIGKIFI